MKFFFVAYCFGSEQGQALIGVYKRGLRIAFELYQRGHEVTFFCTGRDNFHDQLTAWAEQCIRFIDIPFEEAAFAEAEFYQTIFLHSLAELRPDVVVIGEAPLAGTLLETTLCAAELRIPLVCLDNAYQPGVADLFCRYHGGMFDGIILTGPSSLHMLNPPSYLAQVPPYFAPSLLSAQKALREELALPVEQLIVVLAYDFKVELLGISIVQQLDPEDYGVVFLSADVAACRQRIDNALPPALCARIRVMAPPIEPLLFGLVQLAQLAIVKCGFMQVTECLSLHTPVISLYYVGDFTLTRLPQVYQRFAYATTTTTADEATLAVARQFLTLDPMAMQIIHNGGQEALAQAADFLEAVGKGPRRNPQADCDELGFTRPIVQAALAALWPAQRVTLEQYRITYLRGLPGQVIFGLVCAYTHDGDQAEEPTGCVRLWGTFFRTSQEAEANLAEAQASNSPRRVLHYARQERILLEKDLGQAALASLEICERTPGTYVPPHIVGKIKQNQGAAVEEMLALIQE